MFIRIVLLVVVYSFLKTRFLNLPEEPKPVQIPILFDFIEVHLLLTLYTKDK